MDNENELTTGIKFIENDEFLTLRTKKNESINVSVHGLTLPKDSANRLESQIHDVIKEEIEKVEQDQLKNFRDTIGSQINIRKESQNRNLIELPNTKNMSIFISLQGLTLPQDSETRLESQIREIIMTSIEKGDIQSDSNDIEGEKVICVCANTSVPGQTVGRGVTSLPSQPYPITIGIIGREDGIRCLVLDPAPYHLRIDEMLISFESASGITWEKQLRSFNLCNGSWTLLVTRGNFHGGLNHISKIYKRCGGTDTLVFAKAKFLGVMTDMINIDFRVFWRLFGGQRLHFTWVID